MTDSNKKVTLQTMLEKAVITKPDDKSIKVLMESGSEIKNNSGPNILTEAAKHDKNKITEAALRAGSDDANKNNSSGVASLKEASKDYSTRMVKGMVEELSKDNSNDANKNNSSGVASLKEASKDYSTRMAKGIAKELSKDDSDDKGLENY